MALTDDIRAVLADRPGTFGIYARNLETSETIEIGAERILPTESTAKTFILVHYARQVEAGTCDPAARVTYEADDRALGSGVVRYLAPGLPLTLDDLAWLMIIVSDNVATHLLLREMGGAEVVNATMRALGLETAWLNPAFSFQDVFSGELFGTSNPRDLAEVYTHLDERCRRILYRQQFLNGLPRRLLHASEGEDLGFAMPIRVFGKTGLGIGNSTESGLFETDGASWVVGAMATDQQDFGSRPEDSAPSAFAEIGVLLHNAWARP